MPCMQVSLEYEPDLAYDGAKHHVHTPVNIKDTLQQYTRARSMNERDTRRR